MPSHVNSLSTVLPPLILLGVVLSGCAAAPAQHKTPSHWSKEGYSWPGQQSVQKQSSAQPSSAPAELRSVSQPSKGPRTFHSQSGVQQKQTLVIPSTVARIAPPKAVHAPQLSGDECLSQLKESGVQFTALNELKGVENPVRIHGPLGGVVFWANDGRNLEMDCRLALALDSLGDVFESQGLKRVRYSGAYTYRSTRSGRLSHHAHGLAIDLHDFSFRGEEVVVEGGFAKNVGCRPSAPRLNQLSCAMRDSALFQEFLTPDYNYDHRNHLHISVPRRDQMK